MSGAPPTPPVLIYDGDCAFCTASAHRIAQHWRRPATAVPWQRLGADGLRELGLGVAEVQSAAYWIDELGRAHRGHAAVARALVAAAGWRSLVGRAGLIPPVSWMAAGLYRLVARYRHRLPGGTDACRT